MATNKTQKQILLDAFVFVTALWLGGKSIYKLLGYGKPINTFYTVVYVLALVMVVAYFIMWVSKYFRKTS